MNFDVRYEGRIIIISYENGLKRMKVSIDSLLEHVMYVMNLKNVKEFRTDLNISDAQISRIRIKDLDIPESWILRLHEYSGISVSELRLVSNTKSRLGI